jgi:hypothetical protein
VARLQSVGIIEVFLGFWAAGSYGRSATLLIVFIGAIALTRGITDIVLAFHLRKLSHEASDVADRRMHPAWRLAARLSAPPGSGLTRRWQMIAAYGEVMKSTTLFYRSRRSRLA